MIGYFIFCLAFSLFAFGRGGGKWVYIVVFPVFLYFLPSTGYDYDYYERAYDLSYTVPEAPFIKTKGIITAEPFYILYQGLISVFTPFNFQGFLVVNFILCLLLIGRFFVKIAKIDKCLMLVYMAPVVAPTIFYFSPRSSISFSLMVFALSFLVERKLLMYVAFSFLGAMLHSQFLLSAAYFFAAYFVVVTFFKRSYRMTVFSIFILAVITGMAVKLAPSMMGALSSVLSFLPSAEVAQSKLHYFNDGNSGIRITSILSIVVYPFFALLLSKVRGKYTYTRNKADNDIFCLMILSVAFLGCAVNVAYFGSPHLAGRLSRFSDYLGLIVIMPMFFMHYFNRYFSAAVGGGLVLLSPILYSAVYGGGA